MFFVLFCLTVASLPELENKSERIFRNFVESSGLKNCVLVRLFWPSKKESATPSFSTGPSPRGILCFLCLSTYLWLTATFLRFNSFVSMKLLSYLFIAVFAPLQYFWFVRKCILVFCIIPESFLSLNSSVLFCLFVTLSPLSACYFFYSVCVFLFLLSFSVGSIPQSC